MGTQTATMRLTKPTVGGDTSPLWPNDLNLDMDLIDRGINQTVTVNVADTNYSLEADGTSSDQALYAIYNITGAWTADRTITLPSCVKIGACINGTTGGHKVILSAGGTTLSVPASAGRMRFEVDGSNNVTSPLVTNGAYSNSSSGYVTLPGGIILQWGTGTTNGSGFLVVNFPISFSSATYSITVSVVGATFGNGVIIASGYTTAAFEVISGNNSSGTQLGPIAFTWMAVGS